MTRERTRTPKGDTYALTAALVCAVLVLTAGIANAATDGGILRALGFLPQAATPNCLSLAEGAGQMCITDVYAKSGPASGGSDIIIEGSNFPYAPTSQYVQDGLVGQFDAINNTGAGDAGHSTTTTCWKDLKSGICVPATGEINSGNGGWEGNAFKTADSGTFVSFEQYASCSNGASANEATCNTAGGTWDTAIPATWPMGNHERSIEVIYTTPSWYSSAVKTRGGDQLFMYGQASGGSKMFGVQYRQCNPYQNSSCSNNPGRFYAIAGNGTNLVYNVPDDSPLYQPNKLITVTSTYKNSNDDSTFTNAYLNGAKFTYERTGNGSLNTISTTTADGIKFINMANSASQPYGFRISSVRLYDRVLDSAEIENNRKVDNLRYLSVPNVTIGGKTCGNVVIESSSLAKCKTGAYTISSGTTSTVDLRMSYQGQTIGLDAAYTYYNTQLQSISPSIGPAVGGNNVTLNAANLPYVPASEYIQNGLVSDYDATDNTGFGDAFHSNTATVFKDLSGNSDMTRQGSEGSWGQNYWTLGGTGTNWLSGPLASSFPTGNAARTLETIFTTPVDPSGLASAGNDAYFKTDYTGGLKQFGMQWRMQSNQFYLFGGNGANYAINALNAGINEPNKMTTASVTYGGQIGDWRGYVNGIYTPPVPNNANTGQKPLPSENLQTGSAPLIIGATSWLAGVKFHSARVYDRALTDAEINHNAIVDRMRYYAPPVVEFGKGSSWSACSNVIMISTARLTCTVPNASSIGAAAGETVNVRYTYAGKTLTISNGYKYATASEPYITSTSPAQGPKFAANQVLTLTGNFPTNLTAVTVGGAQCTGLTKQNTNTYTCTIPAGSVGPKDIKVNYSSGTSQTLTSAFEYLDASNDPVKYRVQRSKGLSSGQYEYTLAGPDSIPLPSTSVCPVGYTKSGSVCNAQDATGAQGPYVEPAWTGISTVTLTYPSALTAPATPAGWTATGPTDAQAGYKTLTLTASTLQTSDAVAAMLKTLKWTSTSGATNVGGSITVTLTNGLW